MEAKAKVLLCEDDPNLGSVLKNYLELNDYDVTLERDGRLGLAAFQREKFDLCLLDVMMPHKDGLEVAKKIRQQSDQAPILFLTAKSMEEDKIKGFQIGADDYITKPFDTELLLYKIKAILQRSAVLENEDQEQFKISNIFFDSMLRQLRVGENEYKLSPKENELLKLLCIHRNDFMPRDLALRKIWKKENYFTARSMDVYIAKLRKLLKDDEGLEIINVHGEGFRLLVKNP